MNARAMCPNERPQNERKKAENERTDKITLERTNKPNNPTSEMPAKQRENGQWHEQTPTNPAIQQTTEIHLTLFKTKKSRCLIDTQPLH